MAEVPQINGVDGVDGEPEEVPQMDVVEIGNDTVPQKKKRKEQYTYTVDGQQRKDKALRAISTARDKVEC